ncbi:MAG: ubiquitin-like protein [Promethearchaeota archaeon]
MGSPAGKNIMIIDVDIEQTVEKIKKIIKKKYFEQYIVKYKLNPILLDFIFIFKGKFLPDDLKLSKIDIDPKKDVIMLLMNPIIASG